MWYNSFVRAGVQAPAAPERTFRRDLMFGRLMNNYYYGKSGKGDFKKDDLPDNRFQLFFEMLRVRFSGLCHLNVITVLAFAPLIFVLVMNVNYYLSSLSLQYQMAEAVNTAGVKLAGGTQADIDAYLAQGAEVLSSGEFTPEQIAFWKSFSTPEGSRNFMVGLLSGLMVWLIPCILITGPVEAGIAYITRNWARDEHAFVWSDFKDAVKGNWKQGLGVSAITSVLPIVIYIGWNFYSAYSAENVFFMVPQMLILLIGIVWVLGLTYMYPMMVSYKVKFRELLRNSLILGVARLPQTVAVNLLHLVPAAIVALLLFFTGIGYYALMFLVIYYIVIGITLARFVNASLANAVFDRFINSHIEGAKVNRGLRQDTDEYDEDDEDEPADGAENDKKFGTGEDNPRP